MTLVTTLLDQRRYPAVELANLYLNRWQIETNLRHLKQTLRMDVLPPPKQSTGFTKSWPCSPSFTISCAA